MKIKELNLFLLLMSGILLVTFSCNLTVAQKQLYDTTETTVATNRGDRFSSMVAIGTFSDAVRVTMEVKGEDKYGVYQDPLVPEQDLVQGPGGAWGGTITGLPVGPILTFTARGYDADGVEIFSGVATQVLTGVNDSMIVAMADSWVLSRARASECGISPRSSESSWRSAASWLVAASAGKNSSSRFRTYGSSAASSCVALWSCSSIACSSRRQ